MTAKFWSASLVLSAALLVGCDDKPAQPKVEVPATPSKPALPSVDDVKAKVSDTTKGAVSDVTNGVAGATAAAKSQSSEWMTKLDTAIKANKLDEAQTYVDGLEKIKTNLPADLQAQYEKLKASLAEMKAKATK